MKLGDLVMLIGSDGFMPNIGAVGEIVEGFDGEDFGVFFPSWPCPVPPGVQWYVPPRWLMLIPKDRVPNELAMDWNTFSCGGLVPAMG